MKVVLGIKLYSVKEVAELLGVQPQSVQRYVNQGRLKAQVIGGAKYVSEENLKSFLLNND
jgi:excisionase family DNA binding protein